MTTFVLSAAGGKKPAWLTNAYFKKCIGDETLQKRWDPKVGDYYFCADLYEILKIESLGGYYSPGIARLETDRPEGPAGRGGCDYYLPEPETSQKKTSRPRIRGSRIAAKEVVARKKRRIRRSR
jgi:hypothetical protein